MACQPACQRDAPCRGRRCAVRQVFVHVEVEGATSEVRPDRARLDDAATDAKRFDFVVGRLRRAVGREPCAVWPDPTGLSPETTSARTCITRWGTAPATSFGDCTGKERARLQANRARGSPRGVVGRKIADPCGKHDLRIARPHRSDLTSSRWRRRYRGRSFDPHQAMGTVPGTAE